MLNACSYGGASRVTHRHPRAAKLWVHGLVACLLTMVLSGCASQSGPPQLSLRKVGFSDLPGWSGDATGVAMRGFLDDCERLALLPQDQVLGGTSATGAASSVIGAARRAGDYAPACAAARAATDPGDAAARRFFETWFTPYAVGNDGDENARYTGYFEPEVAGSTIPGGLYQVPLYGRPSDLVSRAIAETDGRKTIRSGRIENGVLVPYWTRAQIDRGALAGQRPLLWLTDPVDVFFLQIQGSGRIRLPSGQVVRVGYAGRNGQPYIAIGARLVASRLMAADAVSMQSIRNWMRAHPDRAQGLMEENPNYVFFRLLGDIRPNQGAPGTLGVDLTPLRSAAVDRDMLPLGSPLYIDTTDPEGVPIRRLMLAQDVGSDIQGPARADLFFGWGERAARLAGAMHRDGHLYLLVLRPTTDQVRSRVAGAEAGASAAIR